jgi:hypothetical protein
MLYRHIMTDRYANSRCQPFGMRRGGWGGVQETPESPDMSGLAKAYRAAFVLPGLTFSVSRGPASACRA